MAPPGMPLPLPNDNVSQFRQFLASQPSLIFIDAEAILKEKEKSRTSEHLFAKTDLHETEVGALPVVMEIIARIAEAEGRPEIYWNEDFKLAHEIWGPGNEGRFLAPLVSITEANFPHYVGRYTFGTEQADGSWHGPALDALNRADDGVSRAYDFGFDSAGPGPETTAGHGAVRQFVQRPLLGYGAASLFLRFPARPQSDQSFQALLRYDP